MSANPLPAEPADPALALAMTSADPPLPGLAEALETWRARLAAAGIACRAAALAGPGDSWAQDLPASVPEHAARWQLLRTQVRPGGPMALFKPENQPAADLLAVCSMQMPDGTVGSVGAVLAPPHNERTVQLVILSLGWLQLALAAPRLAHSQRAARLLEMLGHVGSQTRARAAAQEWANRTAAWIRDELPAAAPPLSLTLFDVRRGTPRFWVAADTAWAEKGAPGLLAAAEVATRAAVEMQDAHSPLAVALPVLDRGRTVAVVVASSETATAGGVMPEAALTLLRASLSLTEPLLRRWQQAERPLWRHAGATLGTGWRRLTGPGHVVWKLSAAALLLAALLLLALPLPDRVTAATVIEGRQRQVVTAPFDGFIRQVLVRPGASVQRGQVMAQLDDRDLRLEQARYRSEREQAGGRLRQAMSERDAPALALALAEVHQAEAQLALVDAKLARATLTAPLDGLLVSGDWVQQIGSPIEIGKEMFEIAAGDGYRVVLHVPDRDIARIAAGQTGTLRLTGQPQAAHELRVVNVTALASVQDGVNGFRVEAEGLGDLAGLRPGMQGIGKIEVGQANLLTIWTRSSIDWLRLKLWSWWW